MSSHQIFYDFIEYSNPMEQIKYLLKLISKNRALKEPTLFLPLEFIDFSIDFSEILCIADNMENAPIIGILGDGKSRSRFYDLCFTIGNEILSLGKELVFIKNDFRPNTVNHSGTPGFKGQEEKINELSQAIYYWNYAFICNPSLLSELINESEINNFRINDFFTINNLFEKSDENNYVFFPVKSFESNIFSSIRQLIELSKSKNSLTRNGKIASEKEYIYINTSFSKIDLIILDEIILTIDSDYLKPQILEILMKDKYRKNLY